MNKLLSRNTKFNLKLFNIPNKNFSTIAKNSSEKSNISLTLITKRNFTKHNKKQINKSYEDQLKKNQEYFSNDTNYLQRVIKVEKTITPEEQMSQSLFYNENNQNTKSKIKFTNKENQKQENEEKQKKTEDLKPEDFLKKAIKETANKKLSDYISEEQRESAQEKYKEINYNYFKQKEVYTRAQIYGVKSKIDKASKEDPEWGTNVHRKFLQRNFLRRNNLFYDFEKESFDDKKINYDFLKSLKLDEPILIYESFLPSLKPMISAKRHTIAYALMLPYAYFMFFFNYDFLFAAKVPQNFAHIMTNAVFIGFVYNYYLMRYYNRALVTQIKYNGKNDSVLFYTHRGFNNGVLEVEHKAADLFGFKKDSWITGDYIYIKSNRESKILYLVPIRGIFHEREAFENIFGMIVDDSEEIEKKRKADGEKRLQDPEVQENLKKIKDLGNAFKNNVEPSFEEFYENKKKKEEENFDRTIKISEEKEKRLWQGIKSLPKRIFGNAKYKD